MIELGQLEANHEEFTKRHTRVIAVSVDGPDDSKKTKQDFPHLVVVADSDHKLVDAVQVLHAGAGERGEDVAAPTTILVDKNGVVRTLFRPTSVANRLSASEVLSMVDSKLAVP
ncbi:MAG TPA: redoxin domain-containing protein [Gemmataceae bacterium]|nr:redoxin domain-containing protein [Gemmataceae bacterium]